MTTIAIPDEVYQALMTLADERKLSPGELVAALIAQEQWEEHAANAYDMYHARPDGPHEALTDEEFLQSLQDESSSAQATSNAHV